MKLLICIAFKLIFYRLRLVFLLKYAVVYKPFLVLEEISILKLLIPFVLLLLRVYLKGCLRVCFRVFWLHDYFIDSQWIQHNNLELFKFACKLVNAHSEIRDFIESERIKNISVDSDFFNSLDRTHDQSLVL